MSELTEKQEEKNMVQLEKVDEEQNVLIVKVEVLEKTVSELTKKHEAKKNGAA